jgi:hypothetical protein
LHYIGWGWCAHFEVPSCEGEMGSRTDLWWTMRDDIIESRFRDALATLAFGPHLP